MFRAVILAVFIHALVLSLVWVGFPVPLSRNGLVFSYNGSFMPAEKLTGESPVIRNTRQDAFILENQPSGFFAPWMRMKDINKPRK
jgi:hypothetical protein